MKRAIAIGATSLAALGVGGVAATGCPPEPTTTTTTTTVPSTTIPAPTTTRATNTTTTVPTTTTTVALDPRCHSPGGTYVTNSLWMISDGVFIRGDVPWQTHDNPVLFVIEGDGGLPSYEAFVDGQSIGIYGPSLGSLVCILTPTLSVGAHTFRAVELAPNAGRVVGPHDFTVLA